MKRQMTCIVCPVGCGMEIELDGENIISVNGNACPRGAKYAETECTFPKRTVSSTVLCENGKVLPVKTDAPIPKKNVMECMELINKTVAHLPISVGDVIIKDVFGANIVATKNMGE